MSLDLPFPKDPSFISETFPALRVRQPIGDIFVASIPNALIQKISLFDVRRVLRDNRDIEQYLGIQRPLNQKRVDELKKYVSYIDATFPTSIIVSIESDYVTYNENTGQMTLSNMRDGEKEPSTSFRNLARVIDGQHRIAGLEGFQDEFDVIVSIFVGSDISDQAYVFATVNLEQTKVNKSLVYDLFDLARTRSPYQTCHNIAIALDQTRLSPFYRRIKRLGVARSDRPLETITQATFVDGLIKYISADPKLDRDKLKRNIRLRPVFDEESERYCFRNLFIEEKDVQIGKIYEQYFLAVKDRWPVAWDSNQQGLMLNRTNGYRALSSAFGRIYGAITRPGNYVDKSVFLEAFSKVRLDDRDFNTDNFPPGTSGEAKLRGQICTDVLGNQLKLPIQN